MESPTNRTETHAVIHSNIQAPSKVFFFAWHSDYVMHLRADCRRCTTNSAVTVTKWTFFISAVHSKICLCAGMGENNCAWNRQLMIHRETLAAAAAIYKGIIH